MSVADNLFAAALLLAALGIFACVMWYRAEIKLGRYHKKRGSDGRFIRS